MEQKENLCCPPEYKAEMFSEFFESEKARALRASEIEAILGDDYDLDRLRELVQSDRGGRFVVQPKGYTGTLFRVWHGQIIPTEKFAWIMKRIATSFFTTREAAENALKGDQHE